MTTKKISKKELSKMIADAISSGAIKPEQLEAVTQVKGASTPQAVIVSYSKYEDNDMITLKRGDNGRPFSFGKAKATMILEALEQIKAFASSTK